MTSDRNFRDFVKSEFLRLELREVLQSRPSVLLGVSQEAEAALETLRVHSVFDLGLSSVFRNAAAILDAHETRRGILGKSGHAPSDVVANSARMKQIADLQDDSIATLDGLGRSNGPQVEEALLVKTIRDLALWPPYVAAKKLVDLAFNHEELPEFDPEAPADLLPKKGEYPTDRVSYETVVMTDAPYSNKGVDLTENGPVDLLNGTASGFERPATGAILTYSQSWYSKAVTLGQLLYSLPLAPGESTKIAIVDWTRRSSATTTEQITQAERLTHTLSQNRAISEIASGVAKEAQEGRSAAISNSNSSSSGAAVGAMIGPVLVGASGGSSSNRTSATVFTTSKGSRAISSRLQQRIASSTQQNAFSVRNKRAAIISEASEQEREQINTRAVTNYNHMHALSIQYYEVLQLYQTVLRIEKCERCLFIPMKVLNFNELAISRFRSILFDAALNSSIQEMLINMTGSVATRLGLRSAVEFEYGPEVARLENASARDRDIELAKRRGIAKSHFLATMNWGQKDGLIISYEPNSYKSWEMAGIASFVGVYWSGNRVSRVIVKSEDGRSVSLGRSNSAPPAHGFHQDLGGPLAIGTISTIELEYDAADTDVRQDITLVFRLLRLGERNAENFELGLQFVLPAGRRTRIPLRKSTAVLLSFSSHMVAQELINHLNENALYYSQQVWLNSDPSLLALQLAPFTFKNKRVIEYIDPAPVAAAANFIAFRWKDEDDAEWTAWVRDNIDKASVDVDTVALPTGGVFAEAVLGRFNSAEKLDITRFWNWQDSPIPITAPEIAAIQAGQQVAAVQPTPGNLESPIVNIQTPPALPDPTGMQGVLQTLAASNLFRDMSGITQAAALAQSGLQNASQGAVAGMNQAGANMATFANFQVEMAKILASLAPMLLGLPPVPPPASKNISNAGAAINQGTNMDARQGGAGQATSPLQISPGSGGLGGSPTGGSPVGGSSPGQNTIPTSSGSRAGAAFDALIGRPQPSPTAAAEAINSTTTAGFINLGSETLPANIDNWQEVFTHVVPNALTQELTARKFKVQDFDFATGSREIFSSPINLDFYEVEIPEMPRKADGTIYSAPDLIRDIRLHMPDLIDVNRVRSNPFVTSTEIAVAFIANATLTPIADIDQQVFASSNPLGAVMRFNTKFEDMGVVLSKFDSLGWMFTTISDEDRVFGSVGTHPVSGNRRFGIREDRDRPITVFNRGADRTTGILETASAEMVFLAGHVIWLSWQAGVVDFVRRHGGFARTVKPISERFNFAKVNQHFRGVVRL